jgi:polyisoprenoid-binding protein YceI
MKSLLPALFLSVATLSACASAPETALSAAPSGEYVLDPTHVSVLWSLSHTGLSNYTARFDSVSGALDFDPENPVNSQLDVRIDPRSVSTGLPDFDETLASSGNYFDADNYPEIRFVSTSARVTGTNRGTVTGNLTLRGVTKPVTLEVVYNGAGRSFGNPGKTLGFSAVGKFKRSDFGMDYLITLGNIGDEITLRIEAEFNEAR